MGVNEQLIIMVGCDIGDEAYAKAGGFDKFENDDIDVDGKKNTDRIAVIGDGMSGEYCMVGIPIYVSERYDPIEDTGRIKLDDVNKDKAKEIKKFVKEKFGIEDVKVSNYVFMHYT